MYFAAGKPEATEVQYPLILDSRVVGALGSPTTSMWKIKEYSPYLDIVEELDDSWRSDLPTDVTECTLFQFGRFVGFYPSL